MGPALEAIKTLPSPLDLVFIDADKPNYGNYYEAIVAFQRFSANRPTRGERLPNSSRRNDAGLETEMTSGFSILSWTRRIHRRISEV